MSIFIGIRHEDKYKMERRAPLTPSHVARLIKEKKLDFIVQASPKRVFTDREYLDAGARVADNLNDCNVILGVKEMPLSFFEPGKTYVFFAHVIKGQSYNMPMLKKMMELKCNLIEYERIVDEQGKRLIFFGKYAGLAGMINSLWSLGQRLNRQGIDTPFLKIGQAHTYHSLAEAKEVISGVGQEIAEKGLPEQFLPLTIGFTGYGNVSIGAQEIAGLLPIKEISPEKLISLSDRAHLPNNLIYKIVFKEKDLSEPIDPQASFTLHDYYTHPENYRNQFEKYIPHLTLLMNCMYWDDRYPRIVTKDYIERLYTWGEPKLKAIGDITCDADGSIECTHKGTEIEEPVFVYDPFARKPVVGFEGKGILVMAVDILPSELPRDSSYGFADALMPFVKAISQADYDASLDDIDLPHAIKKALILHKGELTPSYKYIEKYLH
ncbi:MAG: bifunctional lysine ketoglutarate reductase /saccharopine dehydrogenase family protein [Bacteroidales bacterium]|nr:bifunctional lysine ketoglutarate reductase /saccharopine dehydrogenase family protein [Bacteroidales bacterium]MDZ4205530.1 bifunctional lysine ketoglutarate reductase /saccharopine dehydrogenase family protein [Bacteroidales bacterium]